MTTGLSAGDWLLRLAERLGRVEAHTGAAAVDLEAAASELARRLEALKARDGMLWWAANGGSATICSHLAQDAMNKLGIRSMPLTDAALLTCMANDFGYEEVYARPIAAMARPGDMLVAISSSGNSENILRAAQHALGAGIDLVTLSGFSSENRLYALPASVAFHVPDRLYGIVEVAHLAILHGVLEAMALSGGEAPTG